MTRWLFVWIEAACIGFAIFGALLPIAYSTPLLALWRAPFEALIGGDHAPGVVSLLLGILGGSIAGKWAMHFALVRYGMRRRLAWARNASALGLAAWFAVDSIASIRAGGLFNVLLINVPALFVVGLPLALLWRACGERDATEPSIAIARWVRIVFGVAALSGLGVAFLCDTPIFQPWMDGVASAHYGGAALPESAVRAVVLLCGPIGGCIVAQFLMIERSAYAMARAERWAAPAAAISIGVWFAIDSGWDLVHRGLFNVLLLNVPTLVVTLPPLAIVAIAIRRRARRYPRESGP